MKPTACLLITAAWVLASVPAFANNTIRPAKPTQQQLQAEIASANRVIQDLQQEKQVAITQAKRKAPFAQQGVALFRKYDTLLRVRYVNDDGEFDPDQELTTEDRDNINQLFKHYLHWEPIQGAISSSKARKLLKTGVDRLKTKVSSESSPGEDNNSILQILSKRIDDEKHSIDELSDRADDLGYKVDKKAVATFSLGRAARH